MVLEEVLYECIVPKRILTEEGLQTARLVKDTFIIKRLWVGISGDKGSEKAAKGPTRERTDYNQLSTTPVPAPSPTQPAI